MHQNRGLKWKIVNCVITVVDTNRIRCLQTTGTASDNAIEHPGRLILVIPSASATPIALDKNENERDICVAWYSHEQLHHYELYSEQLNRASTSRRQDVANTMSPRSQHVCLVVCLTFFNSLHSTWMLCNKVVFTNLYLFDKLFLLLLTHLKLACVAYLSILTAFGVLDGRLRWPRPIV